MLLPDHRLYGVLACHDTTVMAYAAYLRVYGRDGALCGDQSVAEIRAAIDGAARDECELAAAMYLRARDRWRAFAEFERAN